MPDPLLLDTHVWIWLLEGLENKLSKSCMAQIRGAAKSSELWLSAISIWEIATLEAKGRIALAMDLNAWVDSALRLPGVRWADLSAPILIQSARLPGNFHGDPADRMLVATARTGNARLVTADERIQAYGKSGHLNVIATA